MEWNEYNECSERQQRRMERKANAFAESRAGKMTRILSPHRYEMRGDVFGRNDLHKLAIDTAYDKNAWPPYKRPPLVVNEPDPIEIFYKPLLDKMCETYFAHAFKKHDYKFYNDIKNLPQFDISSLTEDVYSLQKIKFNPKESDRNIAEQYGSEIFIPCLPEYIIKLNKCHVIYVKLIDSQDGISTIQFDDYIIIHRQVACIGRLIITSEYNADTHEIEWDAQEYITYEDFLTRDIDDMHWSAEEQQFWFDVFGVHPFDSPTIVRMPIVFDTNDMPMVDTSISRLESFIIYRKEDADWIMKECKDILCIEVDCIESGDSVILQQKQSCINDIYPKCLTAIALVNVQLIKGGINAVNPDENSSNLNIGDMIIRTKTPIRTSLKI